MVLHNDKNDGGGYGGIDVDGRDVACNVSTALKKFITEIYCVENDIVGFFKYKTTKQINQLRQTPVYSGRIKII